MAVKINAKQFADAIVSAQHFVKNSGEGYACISCENGAVKLVALWINPIQAFLIANIPFLEADESSFVAGVDIDKLSEWVRLININADTTFDLALTEEPHRLMIKCGKDTVRVATYDLHGMPQPEVIQSSNIASLSAPAFRNLLQFSATGLPNTELYSRPALNHIKLLVYKRGAKAYSSNTIRLLLAEVGDTDGEVLKVLYLSKPMVNVLVQLLPKNEEEEVSFVFGDNSAEIKIGETSVVVTYISAHYPDVQHFFDRFGSPAFETPYGDFKKALKGAIRFVSNGLVVLNVSPDKLEVKAEDFGNDFSATCPAEECVLVGQFKFAASNMKPLLYLPPSDKVAFYFDEEAMTMFSGVVAGVLARVIIMPLKDNSGA